VLFRSNADGSTGYISRWIGRLEILSSDAIGFATNNYANTKMLITNSGNVGIATSSPAATLDVNGTTSTNASYEGLSAYVNTGSAYTVPDTSVNIRQLTLTSNTTITLPVFTSVTPKVYTLTLFLQQDATGLRTVTFAGNGSDTIQWDGGLAPTISTTANYKTILQFTKPSTETIWYGSMVWRQN